MDGGVLHKFIMWSLFFNIEENNMNHTKVIDKFCASRPGIYDEICDFIEGFDNDEEALLIIELELLRQRYPKQFYE